MAKTSLIYMINVLIFTVLIIIMFMSPTLASSKFPSRKNEKVTHLHFFLHDILSGNNPTAVPVTSKATATFGSVSVMDDLLTAESDISSKQVGRAQGMYSPASLSSDEPALLMVMNFVFTEGKYNGSTLSVLGRNAALREVREMPIVGGTGRFRFARGYALAKTYFFASTGDANEEFNVYVLH